MKGKLLAVEGVDLERLARLAAKRLRFVGSDVTSIFCLPACGRARRVREPHAVYFVTQRDAARRGYRRCRYCRSV